MQNFFLLNLLHLINTSINIDKISDNKFSLNLNMTSSIDKNYNQNSANITNKISIETYNFYDLIQNVKYSLLPISPISKYKSNSTCVTIHDQIEFNYTIDFYSYSYRGKIFPENFIRPVTKPIMHFIFTVKKKNTKPLQIKKTLTFL